MEITSLHYNDYNRDNNCMMTVFVVNAVTIINLIIIIIIIIARVRVKS